MKRQLLACVAGGVFLAFGGMIVPDAAIAQNSVVSVPPPQIYDYWLSITRQAGGALVFDGYAPDSATRDRLSEIAGADINWLKLGSGAPASYADSVAFGISVLEGLSEGRFAMRGNIVTVSGVAASSESYAATQEVLSTSVPSGLILAMAEIAAPKVEPYNFAVQRLANGTIALSGHVPSPAVEQALLQAAGEGAISSVSFGSGQPFTFETSARQAIAMLAFFAEGEVRLAGEKWTIAATPKSADAVQAIQQQFAEKKLPEAGWSLSLSAPVAAVAAVSSAGLADDTETVTAAAESAAVSSEVVASAQASVTTQPASAQVLTQCRNDLAALSAQNAILFRSGAAVLASEGLPTLDAMAHAALICPDAAINIEGHTDSDGDAALNMALSVARAEAVAGALVERGVSSDRLYVLGYGESQPIADNATAAGKTQNRRIVVSVRQ